MLPNGRPFPQLYVIHFSSRLRQAGHRMIALPHKQIVLLLGVVAPIPTPVQHHWPHCAALYKQIVLLLGVLAPIPTSVCHLSRQPFTAGSPEGMLHRAAP